MSTRRASLELIEKCQYISVNNLMLKLNYCVIVIQFTALDNTHSQWFLHFRLPIFESQLFSTGFTNSHWRGKPLLEYMKLRLRNRIDSSVIFYICWTGLTYSWILVCCILLVTIWNYLLPNELSTDYNIAVHYNQK